MRKYIIIMVATCVLLANSAYAAQVIAYIDFSGVPRQFKGGKQMYLHSVTEGRVIQQVPTDGNGYATFNAALVPGYTYKVTAGISVCPRRHIFQATFALNYGPFYFFAQAPTLPCYR